MHFKSIDNAFAHLIYQRDRKFCAIESRLPEVGERLVVMHGFHRSGIGIVKSVDQNSPDEKVIITIAGKKLFDVPYTFLNRECWECVKGEDRISSGAFFGVYVGEEDTMDLSKFKLIVPPTVEALNYPWNS